MTAVAVDDRVADAELSEQDRELQETLDSVVRSGEVVKYESPSGKGMLTIDPNQTDWTPAQRTALKSIGIETEGELAVPIPHVLQFLHLCQMRDLDPFLGEAHLVTYGKINRREGRVYDDRTYKLIVGIDGFRKRGEDSLQYAGQTSPEWCGEDGVWKEVWSAETVPVAARVGIFRKGHDVPTYGVAHYTEFVPMVDEWVGRGKSAQRTGRKIPTPMWQKMPRNQTAKCAEAQAWRKAFPRRMAGMYAPEEMERAVAEYSDERRRLAEEEAQQRRMDAYATAQAKNQERADQVVEGEIVDERAQEPSREPAQSGQDPAHVGAVVEETITLIRERESAQGERAAGQSVVAPTDDERAQWLRAELEMISAVMGHPIERLIGRHMRALEKPYVEFTADELMAAVQSLRAPAAARMSKERPDAAAVYARAPEGVAMPLRVLLGLPVLLKIHDNTDNAVDTNDSRPGSGAAAADASTPHEYVDAKGACEVCGKFEDEPVHV